MFVIQCQQGETYGLGNSAAPDAQIYYDDSGNVLYAGHSGRSSWIAMLGHYSTAERAAQIVNDIISKFHAYKAWLAAGNTVKTLDDIAKFNSLQLNRYTLPVS